MLFLGLICISLLVDWRRAHTGEQSWTGTGSTYSWGGDGHGGIGLAAEGSTQSVIKILRLSIWCLHPSSGSFHPKIVSGAPQWQWLWPQIQPLTNEPRARQGSGWASVFQRAMAELLMASFQDWDGIQAGSQVGRLGVSLVERCGNWTYFGTEGPGMRWEPRPLGCGRLLPQDPEGWQGRHMPAVPPLQPAGSSQHCLQRWVAGGETIWSCIKNFTFFKVAERPFPVWALMALILLLKNNVTLPLLFKYGTRVPCECGLT